MNTSLQILNQERVAPKLREKLQAYGTLTKWKQSLLLLITGWAGFSSAKCPVMGWQMMLGMLGSLFLAICGSTVLNMVIDRDIDEKMGRTHKRPLPTGVLSFGEALGFGLILTLVGIGWAYSINPLYGWLVSGGLMIDVIVYSIWLKRKTPYSIIWGGVSGGMPILAGRALGLGYVDLIGILLGLAILLWIPTHIMTFSIKYSQDYANAGVPTFPSVYGIDTTRKIIAWSTALASMDMVLAAHLIGMKGYYIIALVTFGIALIGFATLTVFRPSPKLNFGLFKAASTYMLGSMLLIALAV